jgi:hypothetical protein
MTIVGTAPLEIGLPNDFRLSHAEWWNEDSRFVLIRFFEHGTLAELGLRFDLDKKAFLDDTGSLETDRALREQSLLVWEAVAGVRTAAADAQKPDKRPKARSSRPSMQEG